MNPSTDRAPTIERWATARAAVIPSAGVPDPRPRAKRGDVITPDRFRTSDEPIPILAPGGRTIGYVEHAARTAAEGLTVAGRVQFGARWFDVGNPNATWWLTAEYLVHEDEGWGVIDGLRLSPERRERWSARATVLPYDVVEHAGDVAELGPAWRQAWQSMLVRQYPSRRSENHSRVYIVDGDAPPPPPPPPTPQIDTEFHRTDDGGIEFANRHVDLPTMGRNDSVVTLLGQVVAGGPIGGLYAKEAADGVTTRVGYSRAADYLSEQPKTIPLLFRHGLDDPIPVGEVVYLARSHESGLWAVARVRADLVDRELRQSDRWYFSDRIVSGGWIDDDGITRRVDAWMAELSIVEATASVGTSPVEIVRADIAQATPTSRPRSTRNGPLWDLAAQEVRCWNHSSRRSTPIVDLDTPNAGAAHPAARAADRAPVRSDPARTAPDGSTVHRRLTGTVTSWHGLQ